MATVSRENIGLLNDKITVIVTKEDYFPAFEKQLKDYAKKANIPGFRKGMVPTGMIKKMYGSGVFTEEILKKVEKELNDYMSKEQLEIFAQPLPLESDARQLDMNNPADYTFAFEIGLKPRINIDLSKINVTRNKVEVTDAMIDEEVEKLRFRNSTSTVSETVTDENDELSVTLSEVDADGNAAEGGAKSEKALSLNEFLEPLRNELKGKKIGDFVTAKLQDVLEDVRLQELVAELKGENEEDFLTKTFKIEITAIRRFEPAEMNEAFFAAALPGQNVQSESELREALKSQLELALEAQSRNQLHDQIYHQLIDNTEIEFPESFLKRWIQNGGEKPKTEDEVEKEFPAFINSLKWTLISTQLLNQNEITVEPDEITQFAKQQLLGYLGGQLTEIPDWMDSYAQNMLKDKKFVENTYYQLQTTKLFNLLEGMVSIDEKTVTEGELQQMQHHHEH